MHSCILKNQLRKPIIDVDFNTECVLQFKIAVAVDFYGVQVENDGCRSILQHFVKKPLFD